MLREKGWLLLALFFLNKFNDRGAMYGRMDCIDCGIHRGIHYFQMKKILLFLLIFYGFEAQAVLTIQVCGSSTEPDRTCGSVEDHEYTGISTGDHVTSVTAGAYINRASIGGGTATNPKIEILNNTTLQKDAQVLAVSEPPTTIYRIANCGSGSVCVGANGDYPTKDAARDQGCAAYAAFVNSSFTWNGNCSYSGGGTGNGVTVNLCSRSNGVCADYTPVAPNITTQSICPANFSLSGGVCNPASQLKTQDGVCQVIRSGSSYYGDAHDPDCSLNSLKTASAVTVNVTEPGVGTLSTGTGTMTVSEINNITNTTSTTVYTMAGSTPGPDQVLGSGSSQYAGTGSGLGSPATNVTGTLDVELDLPTDYARQNTLEGVKTGVDDLNTFLNEEPVQPETPELPTTLVEPESYSSGLGGGSCPGSVSMSIMGTTVPYDYTPACDVLETYFKPVFIVLATIGAAFIIVGARGGA